MTRPDPRMLPTTGFYRATMHDYWCIRNADDKHAVTKTGWIEDGEFKPDPEVDYSSPAVTSSEPDYSLLPE